MDAYSKIEALARRLGHLEHASAMLKWDEAVMMPQGGAASRAEALGALAVLSHETASHPQIGEWIERSRDELANTGPSARTAWQQANLREFERQWRDLVCIPADLVARSTVVSVRSEHAWRSLRPRNDWAGFRPLLEEVVALKREEAAIRGSAANLAPYDALMQLFDPGARAAVLDPIFAELKAFLPDFIAAVVDRQRHDHVVEPEGPFPIPRQRDLAMDVMGRIGFNFDAGRLDVSHHPFCGGVPADVRITTRYREDDFASSFMAVLHETGHARYEQGRDPERTGQPAAAPRGMSVHESQSLFMEMQVARSAPFLEFAAPIMRRHFGVAADAPGWDADNLYRLGTRVKPGFIRVDADEVTYPAHVILRYELEQALISGDLEVSDLPDAWDAAMRASLGLATGDNHADGCMQDVHWAAGMVGYFPSYTLGAMIAAQLMAAFRRSHPRIDEEIRRGEFRTIDAWLLERIWSRGSEVPFEVLLQDASGEGLDTARFTAHLQQRYLST